MKLLLYLTASGLVAWWTGLPQLWAMAIQGFMEVAAALQGL